MELADAANAVDTMLRIVRRAKKRGMRESLPG